MQARSIVFESGWPDSSEIFSEAKKKKPRKTQKQTNPNKKNKTGNSKVLQILIRGGGVVRYGGISIIHFNFLYIIVGEQLYHI